LASLIVATFLAQAENQSDLNQLAFNTIIKQTLKTASFTDCFEKLLVRSNFQMNIIRDVFSFESVESVFDIYSVDTDGDYTDERLADSAMGVALSKSRLMERLINEAFDFSQELIMDDQKNVKIGNNLIKEYGVFLTVFVGTDEDGTCNIAVFEDISELKVCVDDIREKKRDSAYIVESDAGAFTGDMSVSIAIEDASHDEVDCDDLSKILDGLDIECFINI
jgi:hypothetical protein